MIYTNIYIKFIKEENGTFVSDHCVHFSKCIFVYKTRSHCKMLFYFILQNEKNCIDDCEKYLYTKKTYRDWINFQIIINIVIIIIIITYIQY